jgi:hypothetical protein
MSVVIRPSLLRLGPLAIEMESSNFSPTSLSEMKTYDVKIVYCPQPTRVDRRREEFVNSKKLLELANSYPLQLVSSTFFVEVSI